MFVESFMSFASLRTGAGLTLEEVANEFGVSLEEAVGWENGPGSAPQSVCRSLATLRHFASIAKPGGPASVADHIMSAPIVSEREPTTERAQARTSAKVSPKALIKSKQRVADHGEVFTPTWLVEKMLDLVAGETERIDSRFLEPACGSGNFLVPILQRKLAAVEVKYGKSDFEKRHYALLALTSLYGIELLADNIAECRANMLEVFAVYLGIEERDELYRAASHVLSLNLIYGDAMKMVAADGEPIRVTEWSSVGRGKFNRRDFRLDSLTRAGELRQSNVREQASLFGGLGRHEVFTPVKDYPPMTVRELAAMDGGAEPNARSG